MIEAGAEGALDAAGKTGPAPAILPPAGGFHGPVKRSVTIAGHDTSVSLEPAFWAALEDQATRRAVPLNALVAEIDALRVSAPAAPNLASALRTWLLANVTHDASISLCRPR